jgi:hypothetical protein
MRVALVVALLASSGALANDHYGSLGLTVATGGEVVTAIGVTGASDRGGRVPIELGGTLALFNKTELRLAGRFAPGIPPLTAVAVSFYGGIRNSFGFEQWKTFFDLDFAAHVTPVIAFGARAGFGVQYDVLPILGVYAQLGAQLGGATSLRLSFEGTVGVQFRTYVFQ